MPNVDLPTLLNLVGGLTDSDEPGSASERFRNYLKVNITQSGDLREYIEATLSNSGDQFNKALQDLINHLGQLLGFDVSYGRYRGIRGDIGHDGLWRSPSGWSIVVETKTTDAFSVRTATLIDYINSLISAGMIDQRNKCLGIYVCGRFDAETSQLEHAIIAEDLRDKLRVISVESLLNLLELKQEFELEHKIILGLLLPSDVRIDPIINLISDIVAQEKEEEEEIEEEPQQEEIPAEAEEATVRRGRRRILSPIDENYTGRSVSAFIFDGKRHEVHSWRAAASALFKILHTRKQRDFENIVLSIIGTKRPYFTLDKTKLRQPSKLPDIKIFFEANLSANVMVKLCYTVIERLGYSRSKLKFEVEPL